MWFRHGQFRMYPWSVNGDDHSMSVTLGFVLNAMVHVLQLGWGWDQKHPLRPWPWLSNSPTAFGHEGWCVSWFGVFVSHRWVPIGTEK